MPHCCRPYPAPSSLPTTSSTALPSSDSRNHLRISRGAMVESLLHVRGILGPSLAAVDAGFGAPLLGEATDGPVGGVIEAEQVADYAAVQQGAVGVSVGQVGGLRT